MRKQAQYLQMKEHSGLSLHKYPFTRRSDEEKKRSLDQIFSLFAPPPPTCLAPAAAGRVYFSARTRRAVVKVKVSTEHIKHHHLIFSSGHRLELVDPFGQQVQLLEANRSVSWSTHMQNKSIMQLYYMCNCNLYMIQTVKDPKTIKCKHAKNDTFWPPGVLDSLTGLH